MVRGYQRLCNVDCGLGAGARADDGALLEEREQGVEVVAGDAEHAADASLRLLVEVALGHRPVREMHVRVTGRDAVLVENHHGRALIAGTRVRCRRVQSAVTARRADSGRRRECSSRTVWCTLASVVSRTVLCTEAGHNH